MDIEEAKKHLQAISDSSEAACANIMDAASSIRVAVSDNDEVQAAVTKILESCNFQDLTWQRVNKIIKLLDELEQPALQPRQRSEEEKLLNGPQLPDAKPTQDEVDHLFKQSGD